MPTSSKVLLVARAVEAQHPDALGHLVVPAGDEPAVAEREQVLGREEAERRADAGARDAGGAERLRRVLDQRQPERRELGERRGAAEQVDGHDRLRPRRDPRGDVGRVEVEVTGSMSAKTGVAPTRAIASESRRT